MAAMIGGLGSLIGGLDTYLEALLLVVSVMGGSLLWWLGLSELIATIRHRLTEGRLKLINRIAGARADRLRRWCSCSTSLVLRLGAEPAYCEVRFSVNSPCWMRRDSPLVILATASSP